MRPLAYNQGMKRCLATVPPSTYVREARRCSKLVAKGDIVCAHHLAAARSGTVVKWLHKERA